MKEKDEREEEEERAIRKRSKVGNRGKVCVGSQYRKERVEREVCLIDSPGIPGPGKTKSPI